MMLDVFDPGLNGAARIEMYRAWVYPDIYPEERGPVLQNWSYEDIEEFVGRY